MVVKRRITTCGQEIQELKELSETAGGDDEGIKEIALQEISSCQGEMQSIQVGFN